MDFNFLLYLICELNGFGFKKSPYTLLCKLYLFFLV